jgi:hypothetical protein
MQDVTNPISLLWLVVCRMFLSSFNVHDTSSLFSQSVQHICCIRLQYHILEFSRYSDLLSKLSKFQYRTKLCSKCSISLVFSLYVSQRCKNLPLVEYCFLAWEQGGNLYITVRMGSWEKWGCEQVIGIIILKSLFFVGIESRSTR